MTIEIPLSRGLFAVIDDEDFDLVSSFKWFASPNKATWYARHKTLQGQSIAMHRLILGLARGDGKKVDHRNGDGLRNTRDNLRLATSSQNMTNRLSSSRSGYRGVVFAPARSKRPWRAHIGNPSVWLGRYPTIEEAALAYDAEARRRYGEFACLNFPLPGERCARRAA